MFRFRFLYVLLCLLLLLGGIAAVTLIWVGEDGETHGWDAQGGELRVLAAGVSWLPRWSFRRLAGGPLGDRLQAGSREGVRVGIQLSWNPSPGHYQLVAGDLPASVLRGTLEPDARLALAQTPLLCLVSQVAPDSCSTDPETDVKEAIAKRLGAELSSLILSLEPDPEAVRGALLSDLTQELPASEAKVLVLGFDGFDWDLVLPWVQAGQMPNLETLMQRGTWGTMETLVPTLSPLIWTTIATGVAPDRHGILDFVEHDPESGAMVPITGRGRRVPAIWNLASALGKRVGVVGWWASWPAEKVRGVMASDRLYYTLTQGFDKDLLREDPPDLVYPPEAASGLAQLRDRAVNETDYAAVRTFQPISEERFQQALDEDLGMEDPVDGFRRILASTRTYLGAGLQIATSKPELLMVYLEGTDTIGHLLSQYLAPPRVAMDSDEAALYSAAVPLYFRAVDRWIGRYLEAAPLDEYAFILVSDHGFKWGDDRPKGLSGTAGPTAPLWHENDAVFVTAGRGIAGLGRVENSASIYQIAPSIASLLGIPTDDEWSRSVLPGVPHSTLPPIDYEVLVPPSSYQQAAAGAIPIDAEAIAKLKALGYLGADGESAADTPVSPPAAKIPNPTPPTSNPTGAPSSGGNPTRSSLNNLAVLKINQGAYDEAEEILRRAIQMSPGYSSPHYNLRRLYMETKRYEDADRELWIAIDKGLRDPERTLDRAAQDYDSMNLSQRSRDLLTKAVVKFPGHEPFWAHLLVVQIRLEECLEGNQTGTQAAARFPNSAPVHSFWGLAAACDGDFETAKRVLERSLQIKPSQPRLRETLKQLQASSGG